MKKKSDELVKQLEKHKNCEETVVIGQQVEGARDGVTSIDCVLQV